MKRPTALGCYIFAGGFTLGVREHFDILAHFEEGPYGTETAAHNIPELRGKIFTTPSEWPVGDYARRVDFIFGNPPCAPWSVCSAGRAVPWRLDPRVGCTQRLYALLEKIQPKVWAFESVRPTFNKGREMIDEMVLKAADLGYTATALMVEGTRHGVPQKRPRFFLVLSRVAIEWEPTGQKKLVTVGDALRKPFKTFTCTKENDNKPEWQKLIRLTKHGERCAAIYSKLHPDRVAEAERNGTKCKGRPSFQNIRLDPDQPSCVITGSAKQLHPTEHRFISIEESAVLCGYPRSFKFLGNIGKQYAQVAQAVMPPVGEYLGRMVARALERNVKAKAPSFERVEIFPDRIEREPLSAQQSLPFEPNVNQEKMMTKVNTCPVCDASAIRCRMVSEDGADLTDHFFTCFTKRCISSEPKPTAEAALKAWNKLPRKPVAALPRADAATKMKATRKALEQTEKPVKAKKDNAVIRATPDVDGGAVKQRGGCGKRIRELILKKVPDDKILEMVHKEFPWSKATRSDISWNKRKLQQQGGAA